MSEQGSDAQMTDEQRQHVADRRGKEESAMHQEEKLTAEQPVTGRDGARYAH